VLSLNARHGWGKKKNLGTEEIWRKVRKEGEESSFAEKSGESAPPDRYWPLEIVSWEKATGKNRGRLGGGSRDFAGNVHSVHHRSPMGTLLAQKLRGGKRQAGRGGVRGVLPSFPKKKVSKGFGTEAWKKSIKSGFNSIKQIQKTKRKQIGTAVRWLAKSSERNDRESVDWPGKRETGGKSDRLGGLKRPHPPREKKSQRKGYVVVGEEPTKKKGGARVQPREKKTQMLHTQTGNTME